MSISILALYLSFFFINSKNLFSLKGQSILNNIQNHVQILASIKNRNELHYMNIFQNIIKSYFKECSEDLEELDPSKFNMSLVTKYPALINQIGLTVNDIEDEIECVNSLDKTFFMIATVNVDSFTNKDDVILLKFLDYHELVVSACATEKCRVPLIRLLKLFAGFNNNGEVKEPNSENSRVYPENKEEKEEYKKSDTVFNRIGISYIIYILIKFMVGITRLIYIPKGYENCGNRILEEKDKEKGEKKEIPEGINMVDNEYPGDYNPKLDRSSEFPLWLRIMKFFDIFNDFSFLSKRRNKYFNDNGLEIINLLRVIVLYLYIFSTTFTSLLAFPSKDILNKAFFSSYSLFFYRYSANAGECWIFLEAAYAAYKLMSIIKVKREENNGKKNSSGISIKLIIVYGKFIMLFIPKIFIFIFCYFVFYYNLKKFNSLFSAKTTYNFIVEKVITYNIECSKDYSLIFKSFNTFESNASNFNKCYDFTFLNINILICISIFMVCIFIIFLLQKMIFELFFYLFFLVFFFGLMLIVNDKKMDSNVKNIYSYYHFKGQNYTTKILFLALGVYNLGFIFGILCFNYNILKYKWNNKNENENKQPKNKIRVSFNYDDNINEINNNNISKDSISSASSKKDKRNNNNISRDSKSSASSKKTKRNNNNINFQKIEFYPLSFFNNALKWLHFLNFKFKLLIIIICLGSQIFISFFFKFYSIISQTNATKEQKEDTNFDRNYVLEMNLDGFLKFYFYFEKHFFLILFFIICVTLITLPKSGIFKKLIRSSLITTISRSGFIIICLCYIISNFSFCGFLIKIKFNIPTFIIISVGNFVIIFVISLLLNITFELPIRIIVKKILRLGKNGKKNVQENQFLINEQLVPNYQQN